MSIGLSGAFSPLGALAAKVTELEDAPTLNYIRGRIIHYYPD